MGRLSLPWSTKGIVSISEDTIVSIVLVVTTVAI